MQSEIIIHEYKPEFAKYFYQLNKAWIEKYFVMEELDHKSLEGPEEYIIDKGGYILFAEYDDMIVGCCALIKMSEKVYELAKMAVDPSAQGKHIGLIIGEAIIKKAKSIGAKKLFLESNTKLTPAINLYRKVGFKEIPHHPSEYSRSNIQMELEL
ncbi:MAG: GNAT family N-acetyltransferase [Fimbriimonadaceae bacterium]|nr:GNAT family N-acetyltransferase [Chitinophagales bacterium]